MGIPRIDAFLALVNEANDIMSLPNASDDTKYHLIFSEALSGKIRDLGIPFEYYDPDTSHGEDVRAYVDALNEKAKEFRRE